MSRCSVCDHQQYRQITVDLLQGASVRDIEKKYEGLSRSAVGRHVLHVPAFLRKLGELEAEQAAEVAEAVVATGPVLEQARYLNAKARRILEKALASDDHELALTAIGRALDCLKLQGRLTGELDARNPGDTGNQPLQVTIVYADRALVNAAPAALPEGT